MDITHFLARVIGPYLVLAVAAVWVQRASFAAIMDNLISNRALYFVSGLMALLLGLVVVGFHNVWVVGWPVLITLIGWMAIVKGLTRLFWPEASSAYLRRATASVILKYWLALFLLIGLVLTYAGFMM